MKMIKRKLKLPRSLFIIINYANNMNMINGLASNLQMVSGNNNASFSYESADQIADEIKDLIAKKEDIEEKYKKDASKRLQNIKNAIKQKKKPNDIKSTFVKIKEFFEKVGVSSVAGVIQSKIQSLFG